MKKALFLILFFTLAIQGAMQATLKEYLLHPFRLPFVGLAAGSAIGATIAAIRYHHIKKRINKEEKILQTPLDFNRKKILKKEKIKSIGITAAGGAIGLTVGSVPLVIIISLGIVFATLIGYADSQ